MYFSKGYQTESFGQEILFSGLRNMDLQLQETIDHIQQQIHIQPRIAVILGSGLGSFADRLENTKKLSADTIPHYPKSTVQGHQGYLVFGEWKGDQLI